MATNWQLRKRYPSEEELDARYSGPARQIGGAIQNYLSQREAATDEENKLRAAGAEQVAPAPTPMDRLRRVGRGIQTIFSGQKTGTDLGTSTTSNARDGVAPSRIPRATALVDETITTPSGPAPISAMQQGTPRPRFMTPERFTRQTFDEAATPPSRRLAFDEAAEGPGAEPDQDADDRPRIGSALGGAIDESQYDPKPFEMTAKSGARFRIDPSLPMKRERAAHDADAERQHRYRMEELSARPKPLTFEQRQALQNGAIDRRAAAAEKLARIKATTGTNSAEYREAELELRRADILLRSAQREETDAASDLPNPGVDELVVQGQPGGPERISAGRRRVATAHQGVVAARGAVQNAGRGGAPAPAAPQAAKPDAATRATALRAQGKSKIEVYNILKSEGYNVLPPRQ